MWAEGSGCRRWMVQWDVLFLVSLPFSSISLSPPNPLTLCLKNLCRNLSPFSSASCAAHSHINSSTNRWKNARLGFTLHVSISPLSAFTPWQRNATPHIFKVCVLNFLLTESCFPESCSGGGGRGRGIIYRHSTHSSAESTESQDKRVRTPHVGSELLSSLPVHKSAGVISSKCTVNQLLSRIYYALHLHAAFHLQFCVESL